MTESTRRKRPHLGRSEPNRAWTQAFPGSEGDESSRSRGEGDASAGTNGRAPTGAEASAQDTVNNAYRLIDEYLRQGQRMATNAWLPFNGNAQFGEEEPFTAPTRLLRAMSDMTMAWFELLQRSTGSAPGRATSAPTGTAGPFSAGTPMPMPTPTPSEFSEHEARTAGAASPLKVVVQSSGRVEVSVELTTRTIPKNLVLTELRCSSNEGTPVEGVGVDSSDADAVPTVRIVVPDAQLPGTYNGLLLEGASRRPCGIVSLLVLKSPVFLD